MYVCTYVDRRYRYYAVWLWWLELLSLTTFYCIVLDPYLFAVFARGVGC